MEVSLLPASGTKVLFRIRNTTDKQIIFCKRSTPFEGIKSRIFRATDGSGNPLKYHGIMMKRGPPSQAEYENLGPQEVREIEANLSMVYPDLKAGKNHKVKYFAFLNYEHFEKIPNPGNIKDGDLKLEKYETEEFVI